MQWLMDDSDDNCDLSDRDEILTYLAARNRPEAVPYLEAIARNQGRYILRPEDAVKALITMDDATAADALAALAPSLPDDSLYRVAKRLTDLGHEKAAEVLCGWIDTYRPRRHSRAPYWMMNLLLKLRVPRAADLIDHDVVAQFSDGDRLLDLNWSIPDAIKALTGLGRPGADVLTRWAQDDHFPHKDRIAVLDALDSLGDKRGTTLRDAMPQGRKKRWSRWKRPR